MLQPILMSAFSAVKNQTLSLGYGKKTEKSPSQKVHFGTSPSGHSGGGGCGLSIVVVAVVVVVVVVVVVAVVVVVRVTVQLHPAL